MRPRVPAAGLRRAHTRASDVLVPYATRAAAAAVTAGGATWVKMRRPRLSASRRPATARPRRRHGSPCASPPGSALPLQKRAWFCHVKSLMASLCLSAPSASEFWLTQPAGLCSMMETLRPCSAAAAGTSATSWSAPTTWPRKAGWPSTRTRPRLMYSFASRREQIPRCTIALLIFIFSSPPQWVFEPSPVGGGATCAARRAGGCARARLRAANRLRSTPPASARAGPHLSIESPRALSIPNRIHASEELKTDAKLNRLRRGIGMRSGCQSSWTSLARPSLTGRLDYSADRELTPCTASAHPHVTRRGEGQIRFEAFHTMHAARISLRGSIRHPPRPTPSHALKSP